MSFIAIIAALLLEQARPVGRTNAVQAVLRSWVGWCGRTFDAGKAHHAWLAWSAAVLLPAALVLAVYWLLVAFVGWPMAVVWNIAILYHCLGFRQFSHHFTDIRDALEANDEALARRRLAHWQQVDVNGLPRSEIVRHVVEHSVIAAHRHVFGALAWFSLLAVLGLGPVGAVIYRLAEFVPRYWAREKSTRVRPVSESAQDVASHMWYLFDWLPARITAVGFAVTGSFEDAIDSWRNYERRADVSNDGVILASTSGAINLRLSAVMDAAGARAPEQGAATAGAWASGSTDPSGQVPEAGHLRVVVGLVWRTVVMWLVLLALLSLARLLG
ncbi:MAG: CobD/CbiB family protein [Rhodanobacteraceae bacterium]|nr:CobD/CbiB family protein [Rhodanobacteraceae bacterium]